MNLTRQSSVLNQYEIGILWYFTFLNKLPDLLTRIRSTVDMSAPTKVMMSSGNRHNLK